MFDIDKILSPIPNFPNFSGSNERATPTSERAVSFLIRLNEIKPAGKTAFDSITADYPDIDNSPEENLSEKPVQPKTAEVTVSITPYDNPTTEHRVVLTVEEQRIQAARAEVIEALNNPMRGKQ